MNLPPDPDNMNNNRAAWAAAALEAFGAVTGTAAAGEEDATILQDMLCDLMHWADRNEVDFARCVEVAQHHYNVETMAWSTSDDACGVHSPCVTVPSVVPDTKGAYGPEIYFDPQSSPNWPTGVWMCGIPECDQYEGATPNDALAAWEAAK